jgi:phage/plasmid-associated DNA primase
MVGGDLLDCEIKGSMTTFSIRGEFNILMTSNTRLKVRIESDRSSWKRRIAIIRYDRPYTGKEIPEIAKYLVATEGPGILNWFIRGAKLLLDDIQQSGNLVLSEIQQKRVEDLLNESDSIRIFLKQSVQRASEEALSVLQIVEAYNKFCIDRGWDPIAVSTVEKRLPDLMSELFGVLKSHDIEWGYGGLSRGFHDVKFRSKNDEN